MIPGLFGVICAFRIPNENAYKMGILENFGETRFLYCYRDDLIKIRMMFVILS